MSVAIVPTAVSSADDWRSRREEFVRMLSNRLAREFRHPEQAEVVREHALDALRDRQVRPLCPVEQRAIYEVIFDSAVTTISPPLGWLWRNYHYIDKSAARFARQLQHPEEADVIGCRAFDGLVNVKFDAKRAKPKTLISTIVKLSAITQIARRRPARKRGHLKLVAGASPVVDDHTALDLRIKVERAYPKARPVDQRRARKLLRLGEASLALAALGVAARLAFLLFPSTSPATRDPEHFRLSPAVMIISSSDWDDPSIEDARWVLKCREHGYLFTTVPLDRLALPDDTDGMVVKGLFEKTMDRLPWSRVAATPEYPAGTLVHWYGWNAGPRPLSVEEARVLWQPAIGSQTGSIPGLLFPAEVSGMFLPRKSEGDPVLMSATGARPATTAMPPPPVVHRLE
jgi:hypothetical protein